MQTTSKTKHSFGFPLAKLLFLFSLLLVHKSFAHFGSKGPFGGTVTCGITHDSVVYLGTEAGGVFQSTNSRLIAWIPRPVGLKSGNIAALAHTGKYLFAGTADSGIYIFNGYVGSDRYWIKKNKGLGNFAITSLVAIDSFTVLAGTMGGGVFKTTNSGDSWVSVGSGLQTLFDITSMVKAGNRIVYATRQGAMYASDDKGATWFDFTDVGMRPNGGLLKLAYNAATDQILGINSVSVYRMANASTTTLPFFSIQVEGWPVGTSLLSVSGDNVNWYLTTSSGVFRSEVSTIDWKNISGNLPSSSLKLTVPFRSNLLVGTQGYGVYKSASPYATWTTVNTNFNNLSTHSIATSGPLVVVAATEKGVFVSTDLAANYRLSNKGLEDSLNVTDLTFAGTQLWASTMYKGVFMSPDTGKTWSSSNTGLGTTTVRNLYTASSRIFATGMDNKVYTKQVTDASWVLFQEGLPSGVVAGSLAFSGDLIFLGSYMDGVFVRTLTTDWQAFNTGLSNMRVTCLTVSGNKLFAGTLSEGVFVTDVNQANWTATAPLTIPHATTMGLNSTRVQALASDKGYVFASYEGGLVATSTNGVTWIEGGNQFNLPSYTNVNKIVFTDNVSTTARGRVFVTTEHNSLYSNALSEIPLLPVGLWEDYLSAKQNLIVIPNPNKGQFKIEAMSTVSEVSIYDASGRLVQAMSGTGTLFSFDLKKGIYLIKAKTEKGIATQRFVVE